MRSAISAATGRGIIGCPDCLQARCRKLCHGAFVWGISEQQRPPAVGVSLEDGVRGLLGSGTHRLIGCQLEGNRSSGLTAVE